MKSRLWPSVFAILLPVMLSAQGRSGSLRVVDLGTLPGGLTDTSSAAAINARGDVVGVSYVRVSPDREVARPFVWTKGTMTELPSLPGGATAVATGTTIVAISSDPVISRQATMPCSGGAASSGILAP